MKTIKQIMTIVNRKRISKVDIFDKTLLSSKDSKFTQFYDAVEAGEVNSDEEASILLYGDENSASYRKLKSRFLSRLLNTLFFLDLNNSSGKIDYKYAHYHCMKALMHAKLLRFFGAFGAAAMIIKQRYSDARKYYFYDILAEYSGFLLQFYSLSGNSKALKEELENYNEYKKYADSENQSKLIYFSSIVEFIRTGSVSELALSELNNGIVALEEEVKNVPTIVNIYNLHQLRMIKFEATFDYEGLLKECDKTYDVLEKHAYFNDKSKVGLVTWRKLIACLNVKDFKQGIDLYNKSEEIFIVGSINWFNLKKFGALLAFHSGDREAAYRIFIEGVANKRSKSMSKTIREFWSIYGAYCQFLMRMHNEYDKAEDSEELTKFRLYKFLNEVPLYSKDKTGYNVSLLIIKFIFSLVDNKYEDIIQSIDSLKVYRSRYLKEDINKRAYVFIGMLLRLEKESFKSQDCKAKCENDLNLLIAHSYSSKNKVDNWPVHEWEVMPFEKLWFYIIKILEFNELTEAKKVGRNII
jgi:hypothetical protein